ncbi:MAG: hypothetical protein COA70_12875 [Planctomycetota bacterium]|nr:MAG: hypothetical protein COA70_12875 [Planctomycetota bacterium]
MSLLACGGILSKTYEPTDFFEKHDGLSFFKAIENETIKKYAHSSSTGEKRPSCSTTFSLQFIHSTQTSQELMISYADFVQSDLLANGCVLLDSGNGKYIPGFNYRYATENRTGVLQARAFSQADGSILIEMTLYEHEEKKLSWTSS